MQIKKLKEKYLQYLPSKKFAIVISALIVLMVIIFIVFFMSSGEKNFSATGKKQTGALKVENASITDLVGADTDGDGIPDWEEALWGTDKNKKITFGDIPDSTYINNKKKELTIEQSVSLNQAKLTETEKFAREFFSSYSAMKSSGQVDKNTIDSFSNALGQKIVNPELIDQYSGKDVKINSSDELITKQKYYGTLKILFQSYKTNGLGTELEIINKILTLNSSTGSKNDTDQYAKLTVIANAYKDFAKKMMSVSVPQSLEEYHLKIANSSNNTGISILNMEKIISDPIIGLSGLSQYQKYSDDLVKTVTELETALLK